MSNTWSPLRDRYPSGCDTISLAEIIEYTVSQSDNNGCDILLRLIGGTDVVESYLRDIGVRDCEIKVNEKQMHESWDAQFLNWTTAGSAAKLLVDFYKAEVGLSPQSIDFLFSVMKNITTGAERLRGLLPLSTVVAHKTGTSDTDSQGVTWAINDIGVVVMPQAEAYAIAVFITQSRESMAVNERVIADISRLVWDELTKNYFF